MSVTEKSFDLKKLRPRIKVLGVGGAGGNAVNNMIRAGLQGVDFIVANTDAQALIMSEAERIIHMGVHVTGGLGAGSAPDIGRAAAEEVVEEIGNLLAGAHMVFITAGMGGGTGTGASPVVANVARELGILTVGVVTKPFQFEGQRRMWIAEQGISELQSMVDTLIIIPNQNLFRVANEKTTFADAFAMADQVLYSGVSCITDLMVKEGLINLDFADVRSVMLEMGKAMMGTGEASGDNRALQAADAAIANPLLYDVSMRGARGLLISISGGSDLTLFEVDEAASRIRQEADPDANIIVGASFDESLSGAVRVSVVATGLDHADTPGQAVDPSRAYEAQIDELALRVSPRKRRIPHSMENNNPSPTVITPHAQRMDLGGVSQESIDAMAIAAVADALFTSETNKMDNKTISQVQPMPQNPESSEFNPRMVLSSAKPAPASSRRMPRIDELPIPTQHQIRTLGQRLELDPSLVKPHKTLLHKLAVTFGGREREHLEKAHPPLTEARVAVLTPAKPSTRQAPEAQDGYRGAAEISDQHPLDIPNFLRR